MSSTQSLDEQAFDLVADRWLKRLEETLGELDPDECDVSRSMGVLKLEFADGQVFVINSHRAARQIWVAANLHAWHFSYDPGADDWTCDRTGSPLLEVVEEQVGAKLAHPIRL